MQWQIQHANPPETLDELRSILLANRHITSPEEFFQPSRPSTLTPEQAKLDSMVLKQITDRLHIALQKKESVVIFGDYDVDGVCATATLWEGLRAIGITARPFIPQREKHGYGLSLRSLPAVLEEGKPDLVITVDNGIVAHSAVAALREQGIDVIITDHHEPELQLPNANYILHSPLLCGTTVAWFLVRALSLSAADSTLDLTVFATIADQMDVRGINRSFVVHGLQALRKTQRLGLQALIKESGLNQQELTVQHVNYALAPRINAMGRLKHSLDALRLLCTTSSQRATTLSAELQQTNTDRQEKTQHMIEHAIQQADEWLHERIIIVASESYHEGIIGLIASKLKETYGKPAIAMAIGTSFVKASARSLDGIDIVALIRSVREDLVEVGGHPLAAGFGFLPENLEQVKKHLYAVARQSILETQLVPRLLIDAVLSPDLVTLETAQLIEEFAPFGRGNSEPVFAIEQVQVLHVTAIGKEQRHLKLEVEPGTGQQLTVIGWQKADQISSLNDSEKIDLAGSLQINSWHGHENIQMILRDWRPSEL